MEIKHRDYYNDDASFEVEIPVIIARLLKNLDIFLQSIEKDCPASLWEE
ncbi:MAG: hypothetical protein ACFE9L_11730 [Candidatus Hodarchaeota archaeon]